MFNVICNTFSLGNTDDQNQTAPEAPGTKHALKG